MTNVLIAIMSILAARFVSAFRVKLQLITLMVLIAQTELAQVLPQMIMALVIIIYLKTVTWKMERLSYVKGCIMLTFLPADHIAPVRYMILQDIIVNGHPPMIQYVPNTELFFLGQMAYVFLAFLYLLAPRDE